jgi:hypothetical protein
MDDDNDDEFRIEGNTDWFSIENMNEALNAEYEGCCPCCGCNDIRMLWEISSCRNKKCPIWIARVAWKKDTFPFLKPVVKIWFEKDHFIADLTLPKDQQKAREWALNVLGVPKPRNLYY